MKKEQIHACALARAIIGLWEARKSLMEGSVFAATDQIALGRARSHFLNDLLRVACRNDSSWRPGSARGSNKPMLPSSLPFSPFATACA